MSKIVVVSDSHGDIKKLENIYQHFKNETKIFLHCGDSEFNKSHPIFDIYKSVKGNCDDRSHDTELVINIYNHRILVVHGHLFHVKFSLNKLYNYALEKKADIVCFGHSHQPFIYKHENVTFINPGSIYSNRRLKGSSFALIELKDQDINIKHLDSLTYEEYKW